VHHEPTTSIFIPYKERNDMKKVSLDEMWLLLQRYGLKRKIFEMSGAPVEDVEFLYTMITKSDHYRKEQEFIKNLMGWVKK
jgi:hypothetical protein